MVRLAAIGIFLLMVAGANANPWKVQEGSTLLDGTETATYVAGYMFSGKEYEFTSSQVNLRCMDEELVMNIVGDSDLLSRDTAEKSPTIEFVFKVGEDLVSFEATLENPKWARESARVHDGPKLLEYLRWHDGQIARVQLPVAKTGIPEVRELSLENVVSVSDVILNTCGPMEVWNFSNIGAGGNTEQKPEKDDEPPMDLETALSVGLAQKLVEVLIKEKGIELEQIVQALEPLSDVADK